MIKILGMSGVELAGKDATWTASEIAQQPEVWGQCHKLYVEQSAAIDRFLAPLLSNKNSRIILTGAGTSAFVGDILAPALMHKLGRRVESIPTTNLVSGPDRYFQKDCPTLLVSFARSGNSPESAAAIRLANAFVDHCHHLVITCNNQGSLCALAEELPSALTFTLPESTNDNGFAMTSSFSSMLLSAALIFGAIPQDATRIASLSRAAENLMANLSSDLLPLLNGSYHRVIYLGSNEFLGLAHESSLKLLELADGKIATFFESSLGVRHGPKSIVDDNTLVVQFLSNSAYTRQYDLDLLNEIHKDGIAKNIIAVSASDQGIPDQVSKVVVWQLSTASDIELCLVFVVFAQLFALNQSLRVQNTPDHPSSSGTINRVVQGVNIHHWE